MAKCWMCMGRGLLYTGYGSDEPGLAYECDQCGGIGEVEDTVDSIVDTENYLAAVAAEHGTTTDEVRAEYVSALDLSTWKELRTGVSGAAGAANAAGEQGETI